MTYLIQLTKGYLTAVDDEDADLSAYKWIGAECGKYKDRVYASRYITVGKKRAVIRIHQTILERVIGRKLLKGEEVDHKDGDSLNNRRENLRLATRTQNSANVRINRRNKSGYKGAYRDSSGRWCASIKSNQVHLHLGTFDTPEEAHAAYCEAARELHGEFARFA